MSKLSRVLIVLSLAGLSIPAAAQSPTDCSIPGQNAFVSSTMSDIYLWYRDLPAVDPAGFSSPDALLEAIRYRPLDSTFSYIGYRAAEDAFYSESQFIGFGLRMKLVGPNELRIAQVYPGSPAAEAGLDRGHLLLEVNGRAVPELLATGEIDTVFGPGVEGIRGQVRFRDLAGNERVADMLKRAVTIPTVSATRTFDVGGRKVGYILFSNFVQPSTAALNSAFKQLTVQGANELVLDLRYNGGGLVSVAQHLGGLIGGEPTDGQVFSQSVHNDRNTSRNQTYRFANPPGALSLRRVVVITTRASASASELVINALRPFLPVTVVGDTTYGKPVGQYGYNFCDRVLYPVAFSMRNARNEGDFFGGIGADCAAPDDLFHPFGDAGESSLAASLHYLGTGSCPAASAAAARAANLRLPPGVPRPHTRTGWDQLVGAH